MTETGGDRERSGRRARQRPPLDAARLSELALRYVSRFATTRSKLRDYLRRKVRERGWTDDAPPPDLDALVSRFAELGYVDDAAFARAKAGSLTSRGYGIRRVRQSLQAAGVGEEDSSEATEIAETGRIEAALRFARRRRLGPYSTSQPDPDQRRKALAAFVRAGHDFALAKAVVEMKPGARPNVDDLT